MQQSEQSSTVTAAPGQPVHSPCCGHAEPPVQPAAPVASSCCGTHEGHAQTVDWLLWTSVAGCVAAVAIHLTGWSAGPGWLAALSHKVAMLLAEMWWGLALGMLAVGLLSGIPREFIMSAIGRRANLTGLLRATAAGLMLDLCNHGILFVAMTLYRRGATLGQTMAFLIASPWNSLTLTLILASLIGWPWTAVFILSSAALALSTGWIFEMLVARGVLPPNPHRSELPADFRFWREAKRQLRGVDWSPRLAGTILIESLRGSRMILRWLLLGVLLAAMISVFVPAETFSQFFGPTLLGLGLTLVAATIIEVCSEGSTPIAAELFHRAAAPGNAFAFLMAGAATDYTEIMALRETTRSWKITLFLPLLTTPQILLLAWLMNRLG